jgi:hypothetical protein
MKVKINGKIMFWEEDNTLKFIKKFEDEEFTREETIQMLSNLMRILERSEDNVGSIGGM